MPFSPHQKQFAKSFLIYQGEQPQGLPKSIDELQSCYSYFCALQPAGTIIPSFRDTVIVLKKIRMIKTRGNDLIYMRNVCIIYYLYF